MTEQDWDGFKPNAHLHPATSGKMLQVIEKQIGEKQTRQTRILYIRRASVAAAALILSLGIWKWTARSNTPQPIANISVPKTPAGTQPLQWAEKANHTGKPIHLSLPDKSTVDLSRNSVIRYLENNNRDIILEGQAVFNVAKDQTHPFTVHAAGFATTALGTSFRVAAYPNKTTSVTLLSGKIVVRPDTDNKIRGLKDAFLSPGQQWQFDPQRQIATIFPPKTTHTTQLASSLALTGKIFHFDNQSLADIFHTLEKDYHYTFTCKNEEVNAIRFTGVFDNSKETLASFVGTIATLNALTVTQKENVFLIN